MAILSVRCDDAARCDDAGVELAWAEAVAAATRHVICLDLVRRLDLELERLESPMNVVLYLLHIVFGFTLK